MSFDCEAGVLPIIDLCGILDKMACLNTHKKTNFMRYNTQHILNNNATLIQRYNMLDRKTAKCKNFHFTLHRGRVQPQWIRLVPSQ